MISNLQHIRSRGEECISSSNIISVTILMLMMILLYLFLGVYFMNNNQVGTYIGNENNFDLFYYMSITFITIGYGE